MSQVELDSAQNQIIEKQNLLVDLQRELQNKTNEIINLQKLLQNNSQQQLSGIERIKNPIPEELDLFFSSTLDLQKEDLNQIVDVINQNNFGQIPSLPFNSTVTNKGFEKINSFKRIMLYINILLEKDSKTMSLRFRKGPLNFVGYHTSDYKNSFLSIIKEDIPEVIFSGNWLYINDISTNFKSPSILDFDNSNVQISFEFLYPQGNSFIGNNPNYLVLNLKEMSLKHKYYTFEIKDIKRSDKNKFCGKCIIK